MEFARRWELADVAFLGAADFGEQIHRQLAASTSAQRASVEQVTQERDSGSILSMRLSSESILADQLDYAMAVMRYLAHKTISINLMIHRFGLEGEIETRGRASFVTSDDGVTAVNWRSIDRPVPYHISESVITAWEGDPIVKWIGSELLGRDGPVGAASKRLGAALVQRDKAFLQRDLAFRSLHIGIALESLLANPRKDTGDPGWSPDSFGVAARAAFLTCPNRDDPMIGVCPYAHSRSTNRAVKTFVREHHENGEWRCSGFMGLARPEEFDSYFENPSIFSMRNQAAHTGKTDASEQQVNSAFFELDRILDAYVQWAHIQNPTRLADLDDFIDAEVSARGLILPGMI